MKELVMYIHGKGGSAAESEITARCSRRAGVIGLDYGAKTPWEAGKRVSYRRPTPAGPKCIRKSR